MAKTISDLSEAEILALAISLEEEDSRIDGEFADGLRERYPQSAQLFDEMQREETEHHARLLDIYRQRFGAHIPLIRRQDVDTPLVSATVQVVLGGMLVFLAGWLIGSA